MPYTSDSWTFGHVPTTFKRLPTVNRWGVLHGFYSDQRDDQELSNSAPDMPSRVGFRILANRSIWRFPNIPGQIYFGRIPHDNYATASSGSWITAVDGAANSNKYQFAGNTSQLSAASVGFVFDPSTYNNTYRNVQTVQVDALKGLCLIKSF